MKNQNHTLILFAVILWLFPLDAYAWAPGTHLYFAKELLQLSALLPAKIRDLLLSQRLDFLYGCIAADITIGKAYVDYIYNCHNFDVALDLLKRAKTPPQEAFVLGYLSHLACDTVAHNYFVPYQNVAHFEMTSFRHAYWEVRLDHRFNHLVWDELKSIIKNKHTHSHDRLLDDALKDTIFSFRTNKILFSSMLAIQRFKKWQQFVHTVDKRSALKFNEEYLKEYNRLAVAAMILLFTDWKKSPVYRVDPTGAKTIEEAQNVRRLLRNLKRAHEWTPAVHKEECRRFREHVKRKYFSEYEIDDKRFRPALPATK